MKIVWGVNAQCRNATLTAYSEDRNTIVFAGRAEHYSRIKNDSNLNIALVNAALQYGAPTKIIWNSYSTLTRLNQVIRKRAVELAPRAYMKQFLPSAILKKISFKSFGRHYIKAAGGFFTSGFKSACIIVVDDVPYGETISIWMAHDDSLYRVYSKSYPDSLGLFYRRMALQITGRQFELNHLMNLAAYGKPNYKSIMLTEMFDGNTDIDFELNRDLKNDHYIWRPELKSDIQRFNIAATTQDILEEVLHGIISHAKIITGSENLVYVGSMAMNSVANASIASAGLFNKIWIPPTTNDSSIGGILAYAKHQYKLKTVSLGQHIPSTSTNDDIIAELKQTGIACVARGRTEFSPFSLGNRSIFVDPMSYNGKEILNEIKGRRKNAVYSCIILEENFADYFIIPPGITSPHRQYTVACRYQDRYSAICRVDGYSHVQTINRVDAPELYELLKMWEDQSGIPMLLNTSLNLKTGTLVNTKDDIIDFERQHNIKVLT